MNAGKMRILHCFRSPVGGIFRHVRDLAAEQHRAGHEVGIVCDSTTGGAFEESLFKTIMPFLSLGLHRIHIERSIHPRDIVALSRSYKEIRSLQPDVLHGHGAKGGALARFVGSVLRVNRYRVARLYTPHGGSLHYDGAGLSGRFIFRIERLQEWFCDALVFVCEFERQAYVNKVGKPTIRNELVYNGIRDSEFNLVPTGPDAYDFLYIGMLRDLKGPDLFIDAFAKAERILKRPLSAMMVGDGPQRDDYLAMMTERGLGRRIAMAPAMPIRDAFRLSDRIVVPSRAESMPYIVLESLGAGKAVIAADVGGISEVLGKTSPALARPADPDDLARIMADSLTVPGWTESVMPDRETFRKTFSSPVMAKKITDLYAELLKDIRGTA